MRQRKKKLLVLGLTAVSAATVVALGVLNVNSGITDAFYSARADEVHYTLALNSNNKVSSSGDHVIKTANGGSVTFTYTNVASSSGHTRINNGGSIVNKQQITSIESFKAIFTGGTLKARIAYVVGTWGEYFILNSNSKVDFGSKPYYLELKAEGGAVDLSSATFTYSCSANPDAEPREVTGSYSITFDTHSDDLSQDLTNTSAIKGEISAGDQYIKSASGSKLFGGKSGLKFGSKNSAGSLEIEFDQKEVAYNIKTIDFSTARYSTNTCVFYVYVNGSSSSTSITPSSGGSVAVNATLETLTIETSAKQAYLCGITLNYDDSYVPGAPENPDAYEVGFTASDANKDIYTTNSVFATDNALTVSSIWSDTSTKPVPSTQYSYVIKDANNDSVDPNAKFPAEGVYTLIVSYEEYIPVEITLNVGQVVYMVDITAAMLKTTFTTADTLGDYLSANLTASITLSNGVNIPDITYSEFAENDLGVWLLYKNVTKDFTKPFGIAGGYVLSVYCLSDENNVYYNVDLTVNAIPVTSIALNEVSKTLYPEDQLQLVATVNPNNATNSNVVWASSNESVATVTDDGLVTAVAVGGATITATAADGSNVYGSCIVTVVAKPVEPTWEEVLDASQLTIGDVIVITNEAKKKELNGISDTSTKYGVAVDYSGTPNYVYPLTIVAGSTNGTYALKNGNSYLNWTSGNSLNTVSSITSNSSWTFSGVSTITNANSSTRLIQYNASSPRFACYENTQSQLTLYKQTNAAPVAPIYPTAISLTGSTSVSIGSTSTLTVGYTPTDTNVKNVTFTSSNTNVATISKDGIVTGVAQGSATITATAEAANSTTVSKSVTITVTPISVTGVSLSDATASVSVGKTHTLVASVEPANATNKNVTWSSANNAVATVSNDGVVTGIAAGTTDITVRTVDGNKSAKCTVTVTSSAGEKEYSITYTDLPSTYQTGSDVYTADSGIKFQAYNCAGGYSSKMQFKASSGYLQNTESLELQSLTIHDRESNVLTVYGSKTAGSFSVEIEGNNDVFDLTGYNYFKVARTGSGAGYCSSITIDTGTPTPTDPTSIVLDPTSAEVGVGGTKQLSVSYIPANANQNKEVTWTSSNTNVATVDSNGLVSVKSTASAGQTATITARLTNLTSIYATCTITVTAQKKDDQTVLIYMCGSDLETKYQLATGDITEILSVSGQPDDVNIVIETGGAKTWSSKYGISNTKLERWHVANKTLVKDDTLSTYTSMGLTSTLQSFIEYGLNNYPAERTGLILWNHGGGMLGVCYDEKKNDDNLLNSEVKAAVSGALSNCGMSGQKLEWIGYDACLMQVQDIAETNSQYFKYMVASEESEAGEGWDYDNWVDDLYSKKTTTTILKAIVDSFIADNGGASSSSGDQTLSYLTLSYAAAYKTAWENMAQALNSKVTTNNKSSFNSAITSNVKHYADSDYDYFCTFDAWDFVDKLANNSAFSSFRIDSSYITAVKNAHANLVSYNLAQKGAGVSKGLCMYWVNSTQYSDVSTYYTTNETNFSVWRTFNVNKGTHA